MKVVLIGIIALIVIIAFSVRSTSAAPASARASGAFLIIIFGFLFVTVSSRLTGEIGSSSNPISGMTVATLLLTCLIFVVLGWTGSNYYVTALSVGAIVCIASSNGGTTSQDLKTGFLVGATPEESADRDLIGALASALVLGPILLKLNDAGSVYVPVGTAPAGYSAGSALPGETANFPDRPARQRDRQRQDPDGRLRQQDLQRLVPQRSFGRQRGEVPRRRYGTPGLLVDPGINGTVTKLPNGEPVRSSTRRRPR
jgi:hypothetical protein